MDRDVLDHYSAGEEEARLAGWSLERLRTEALLVQHLLPPPSRVLDVGGGPGRYASWMAQQGWRVTLLDPVPLHCAQAAGLVPGRVELGEGARVPHADSSFDNVLLLGPLYHLPDRVDRAAVLQEAARVVRPGGTVIAAAISRLASMLSGFREGMITDDPLPGDRRRRSASGHASQPRSHAGLVHDRVLPLAAAARGGDAGGRLAGCPRRRRRGPRVAVGRSGHRAGRRRVA